MIEVKASMTGNVNALKKLPAQVQKAMRLAKRDTLKQLTNYIASLTAEQNYITRAKVKKTMRTVPEGIRVRGGLRPIDSYKLTPKSPRRKYKLMGAVKRSGGMKPLGANTFLMHGKAYARLTAKRFPVKMIAAPAVPQIVSNEENDELYAAKMEEVYTKRAEYWTARLMGAMKG